MKLALRITASSLRGTRDGVPRLANALLRNGADGTFFFTLGPDRTGRMLFRSTLRRDAAPTLRERYGLRSLLYGTLLFGPSMSRRCKKILRRVRDDGFEIGTQGWDAVDWQHRVVRADEAWTARQMQLAWGRYSDVFGELPRVHGAAGWLMNRHALRLAQRTGLEYASDTRGRSPFLPVREGELIACPQLPTTLPTLDELMRQGSSAEAAVDQLLALTRDAPATGHVYSAAVEREGLQLLQLFERLLDGWRAQGYALTSLRTLYESLDRSRLPHCLLDYGAVPGRVAPVLLQGEAYLNGATERIVLPERRRYPRAQSGYALPRRVDEPNRPRAAPRSERPETRLLRP